MIHILFNRVVMKFEMTAQDMPGALNFKWSYSRFKGNASIAMRTEFSEGTGESHKVRHIDGGKAGVIISPDQMLMCSVINS